MSQMNASILVRLRDRLSAPARVMTRSLDKMNAVGRGIKGWARDATDRFEAMEERLARLGQMTFVFDQMNQSGRTLLGFLGAPIGAAMTLQEAMAEVAKVTDFDTAGLKQFERDLLRLSRLPGMPSAGELAQIAAQGAQGGISEDDLLGYARSAAMMGTAFDMAGDQSGKAFVGFRKIFALSNDEAFRLGGTINHLSNNMAANAAEMTRVINRSGAQARQFGLSAEQVAALSASFLELQVPPEVAGTAINAMLVKLQTFDKQGPRFADGLKALGIEGAAFKRQMERNPQAALTAFLEKVEQAEDKTGILFDLFGQEYVDDISRLVGGIDSYRNALALANDTTSAATSLSVEFEARASTARQKLRALNQSVANIAVNIGGPFLNGVAWAAEKLAAFSGWLADLISKFPLLSTVIFGALGFLGALLTIVGTLGGALITTAGFVSLMGWSLQTLGLRALFSGGALNILTLGLWGVAKAALTAMLPALKAITIFMMTNPIGLILTGIAVVATLIIMNWGRVKRWFGVFWGWLKRVASGAFNILKTVVSWSPLGLIIKAWQPLSGFFQGVFDKVLKVAKVAMDAVINAILGPIKHVKNLLGLLGRLRGEKTGTRAGLSGVMAALETQRAGQVPLAGIDDASGLGASAIANRTGASKTYTDNSTTTIVQREGESSADFARRLEDEKERRRRRLMGDGE